MSSSTPEHDRPGQPGGTQSAPPGEGAQVPPQAQTPGSETSASGRIPGQPESAAQEHAPGGWAAPAGDWGAAGSPVPVGRTRVVGRRVLQYIFDYVVAGIIPALAYWAFDRGSGLAHGLGWVIATVIALAVYFWYWVLRPLGHDGQTFGMQLLRLRVISKDDGRASMGQLLVRAVFLIVDTLFFGLVGLITMVCSRYRQRVGDHVAGTLVIGLHRPGR